MGLSKYFPLGLHNILGYAQALYYAEDASLPYFDREAVKANGN